MPDHANLTRRERQIMEILFSRGSATVNQIVEALPDPPTPMAVRRLLQILGDKGFLKRNDAGREIVYRPKESRTTAGKAALKRVLNTFFGGSLGEALSAHLMSERQNLNDEELVRLEKLIEEYREEGH